MGGKQFGAAFPLSGCHSGHATLRLYLFFYIILQTTKLNGGLVIRMKWKITLAVELSDTLFAVLMESSYKFISPRILYGCSRLSPSRGTKKFLRRIQWELLSTSRDTSLAMKVTTPKIKIPVKPAKIMAEAQ